MSIFGKAFKQMSEYIFDDEVASGKKVPDTELDKVDFTKKKRLSEELGYIKDRADNLNGELLVLLNGPLPFVGSVPVTDTVMPSGMSILTNPIMYGGTDTYLVISDGNQSGGANLNDLPQVGGFFEDKLISSARVLANILKKYEDDGSLEKVLTERDQRTLAERLVTLEKEEKKLLQDVNFITEAIRKAETDRPMSLTGLKQAVISARDKVKTVKKERDDIWVFLGGLPGLGSFFKPPPVISPSPAGVPVSAARRMGL